MAKRKILIIDDDQQFLKIVKMSLEKTGEYEVKAESVGKKALPVAIEYKPHLILLDVLMPGMDGGEVASHLRAQPELKYVPLVFLTALVRKDEASQRENYLDKYDFIKRLTNKQELIGFIEQLLLGKKPA